MKRRRPKPSFAVEQAVYDLVNKFEYPDLDTRPLPLTSAEKGGVPKLVIASASASSLSKQKADLVVINTAQGRLLFEQAAEIMAGGGELRLTEGVFILTGSEIEWPAGTWITGAGIGATLLVGTFNWTFNGVWGMRDLSFSPGGG